MNNSCLYLKWQKYGSGPSFFPSESSPRPKRHNLPCLHCDQLQQCCCFPSCFFVLPFSCFFFSLFFHPSVSGNEARIRVRIQAPWQSSACCVRSRAGLCHSPWARLMIADGQGINWSSEGVGQSSYARRRGSPGTLFVGPLHLLAAAGFSPALTESTGLCLDA